MDSYPYKNNNAKFVDLLNSQQEVVFSFGQDTGEASKGLTKQKTKAELKAAAEFDTMWSIKKEDFAMKERMSRMKLLESLIAKQEPLADYEEALKKKLISELMS
ncbi:hypothetical protein Bca52824_062073 [Brassica carinata]|uniref:No apical meristem-associated C-terminal domain-containing protein n=1 Tax=Brassica carinata TaxID=52824 RepID=A0A8X7QCQ8_BRACI|nr:hypothetical protein Bca52824_062073 [Brassica carinata]